MGTETTPEEQSFVKNAMREYAFEIRARRSNRIAFEFMLDVLSERTLSGSIDKYAIGLCDEPGATMQTLEHILQFEDTDRRRRELRELGDRLAHIVRYFLVVDLLDTHRSYEKRVPIRYATPTKEFESVRQYLESRGYCQVMSCTQEMIDAARAGDMSRVHLLSKDQVRLPSSLETGPCNPASFVPLDADRLSIIGNHRTCIPFRKKIGDRMYFLKLTRGLLQGMGLIEQHLVFPLTMSRSLDIVESSIMSIINASMLAHKSPPLFPIYYGTFACAADTRTKGAHRGGVAIVQENIEYDVNDFALAMISNEGTFDTFALILIAVAHMHSALMIRHNDLHVFNVMFQRIESNRVSISYGGAHYISATEFLPIIIDWGLARSVLSTDVSPVGFEHTIDMGVSESIEFRKYVVTLPHIQMGGTSVYVFCCCVLMGMSTTATSIGAIRGAFDHMRQSASHMIRMLVLFDLINNAISRPDVDGFLAYDFWKNGAFVTTYDIDIHNESSSYVFCEVDRWIRVFLSLMERIDSVTAEYISIEA